MPALVGNGKVLAAALVFFKENDPSSLSSLPEVIKHTRTTLVKIISKIWQHYTAQPRAQTFQRVIDSLKPNCKTDTLYNNVCEFVAELILKHFDPAIVSLALAVSRDCVGGSMQGLASVHPKLAQVVQLCNNDVHVS